MRWAELSTSVRRKKVGKKRMPGSRPDSRNELRPDTEWRFFYFSCLANWPLGHLVASQEWWLCYVRLWLIIIFSCDEYLSHLWHGQNNVENACCSITLSKLAYLYVCLFFSSEAAYTLCYSGLTQMKYDQGGRMEAISLCASPKLWACVAQWEHKCVTTRQSLGLQHENMLLSSSLNHLDNYTSPNGTDRGKTF